MALLILMFIVAFSLPVHATGPETIDTETTDTEIINDKDPLEKTSQLGPVTAHLTLTPARPLIGDTVRLRIEVSAEQGVEVLMPEFGQAFDRFTIVDYVPAERIDEKGRTVATQLYTLQMPASGEHQIPPVIIEFIDHRPGQRAAPEGEDSFELLTERVAFQVQSVAPSAAGTALRPPLGELQAISGEQPSAWAWPAAIITAFVLAVALSWWFFRRWRGHARQRSAYEMASIRLNDLRAGKHLDATTMKPFFTELSAIVRRYLEDRFALHAPELTTEEFLDIAAGSPELNAEHRRFLQEFLQQADQVKFARHIPDADHANSALDAAEQFLRQTRESQQDAKPVKTREAAHA